MKHVGKKEYAIIDIQRQVLQVKKELKKLTDLDQGLCRDEVDVRIKEGQYNVQPQRTTKSYRAIICGNLFTLFNLINVVLALLVFFTGNYRNMLFMGVVASNLCIGIFQEIRSKRVLDRLSLLSQGRVKVIRNAAVSEITVDQIVMDDLLILENGNQIPCDAVVRQGKIECNESLVSGESDIIPKTEGNFLYSGSFVVSGKAVAQVCAVGNDTYVQTILGHAKQVRRHPSQLRDAINFIIKCASIVLIPLGVMLFAKQLFLSHATLNDAITATVAGVVGMIPEGLILLISVALAVGVIKLGKRNTLVQELYGIETLSRADVLCLDKTGTITTGKMTLDSLLPLSGDEGALRTQLGRKLSSMDERSGTLDALRADIPDVQGDKPVAVLPFSSERKKSAVSFAEGTTLILGAPTFVLDDAHLAPIRKTLSDCAGRGLRVLVLAEADGCVTETDAPADTRVIGLCLLTDEIRPAAQETLHYFHTQGVALKIISGDDEKTVAAIARKVGLSGGAVDASTLSDNELPDACERYAVFGRVTPTRKKALVEALKAKGHHVAMTGDGVNDIPALKAADCSIAMAGGADDTKQAEQQTHQDANYANMPLIVAEGRRVVGNITRAASLFLVKTLYSFALALLTLLFPVEYPFQPIQLTLISSLTIGLPAFLLTLEPNQDRIQGSFLRTVLTRAIPGAAAVCICSMAAMAGVNFGWDMADCKTLAALCAGAVGLMMLYSVSVPLTTLRAAVCTVMTAGFVLAVCYIKQRF